MFRWIIRIAYLCMKLFCKSVTKWLPHVSSSEVNYIYVGPNHKCASKGFTICTTHNSSSEEEESSDLWFRNKIHQKKDEETSGRATEEGPLFLSRAQSTQETFCIGCLYVKQWFGQSHISNQQILSIKQTVATRSHYRVFPVQSQFIIWPYCCAFSLSYKTLCGLL